MACKRLASTNKQESNLFNTLYDIIKNEEDAHKAYGYFSSDLFIEEFGDWKEDFKAGEVNDRTDENGEPIINKNGDLYYWTDKYGRAIEYNYKKTKLKDLYSNDYITRISEILAFGFIKDRINDNFNGLDLSERKGLIKDYILNKIKSKVIELQESEDMAQNFESEPLNKSLESIDEWVERVTDYYRQLKIVYKENNELDELEEEEISERGQSFDKSSFEKDSKDNINSEIKLRLSLLTSTELDPVFYEPKLVPFASVISDLNAVLTNKIALPGEDLFEIYQDEINKLSNKKPYLKNLSIQLDNANENTKAQFVQAFNLDSNNFLATTYLIKEKKKGKDIVGYETESIVQNLSETGSKHKVVKNKWNYNFSEILKTKEGTNLEYFKALKNNFSRIYNDYKYQSQQGNKLSNVDGLVSILNQLGIDISENGFNHYLDGLQPLNLDSSVNEKNLAKLFNSTDYFIDRLIAKKIDLYSNPFDDQVEFNNLSKAESFYLQEGYSSSVYSVGKTKWAYSYPSYLSNKLKEWKKDRTTLLNHFNSSVYNQGSYYMKWLLGLEQDHRNVEQVSQERIDSLELNVFNSLQDTDGASTAKDNKDLSKNDAYGDIFNKMLRFRIGGKTYFNTPTPADKSTQYQLSIDNNIFVEANARYINRKAEVNNEVINIIFDYIKSEHERIKQVTKEIELGENLIVHYHTGNTNGTKFQLIPSLNYGNFDEIKQGFSLYDDQGNILDIDLEIVREQLESIIKNTVSGGIMKTLDHIKKIGMIQSSNENKAFDTKIWDSYGGKNTGLKVAGDIFINGLISQVEYSKMFSGDVAYYKDIVDYKKRIPATYTDGLQLYLNEKDQNFNIASIEGVEVATPFYDELVKLVGKKIADQYKKVNSTDAQAWITPNRWKFLKQKLGQWSPEHDIVFDKMNNVNKEPYTKKELKLAAQPLKGVYFEINNNVPVYLKYSQAVLLPNVISNNLGLKKMYDEMVDKKIDELITLDGIKVGSPVPTPTHNADYSIKDFTLTPTPLKNSGWKLQQDLPTKGFKGTAVGSQIQKNIYAGLAFNLEETFNINDKKLTGAELIDHINDIVEKLSDDGMNTLIEEFDIDKDFKINNKEALKTSIVNELKSRGANRNTIESLQSNLSSYGIPGSQQKIQNIFASIVKDRIVKIKTNGGSFIQMSNYGFNKSEAESKGVIWTPWAKDTTHEYTVNEDGTINPAGILISGSLIAKYIPNYKDYKSEELFGENGIIDKKILDNIIGYRIPNQGLASNDALQVVGILPEETGDTVVAYTGITTKTGSDFDIDKMYLMIPSFNPIYSKATYASAKKWVSEELELSKEDIRAELLREGYSSSMLKDNRNNLSLFVEDILLNPMSNSPLKEEFESDFNIGSVSKLEYVEANLTTKKGLQNSLIEAYKAVLLNPKVIKQVMTPIDFTFMKDDINSLFPKEEIEDLESFNIVNEIELKYQFLAGKAGVGMTANALVDHVRGMMADLGFNNFNIGLGYTDDTNSTILDNEYSQELSEKDLKYYNSTTGLEGLKKIKTADALSALMNAYVDIAKDPYITRGNWTTQTANIGFMLLRAGIHPYYVNAILGQPILREYVDFVINSESIIVKNTGDLTEKFKKLKIVESLGDEQVTINGITKNVSFVYETVRVLSSNNVSKIFNTKTSDPQVIALVNSLTGKVKEFDEGIKNFDISKLSLKDLRDQITVKSDIATQFGILDTFYKWNERGKLLRENIVASKMDVDGYGKNITSLIVRNNLVNKLVNSLGKGQFKGFASKLFKNGKNTILGAYKKNSIDFIKKVMEANPTEFLVANENIIATFNEISKGIKSEILLNDDLATKLENSYYSYVMSGFLNLTPAKSKELIDTIPTRVVEYNKNNDNYFLKELDIKLGNVNKNSYISMSNRKRSIEDQTNLINSWADLRSTDKELAEDLIKYSFITSGFQMNMNQFYTYIPYEYFSENNFNDYLNGIIQNLDGIDYKFIDNFFRHNYEDNQIVSRVFPNQMEIVNTAGFVLKEYSDALFVKVESNVEQFNADGEIESVVHTELYELKGHRADGKPVYIKRVKLGINDKGNKIFEYNNIADVVTSNVNKAKYVPDHRTKLLEMIQESEEVKEETIDKIFVFGNDIKTKSGQNISDLGITEKEWNSMSEEEQNRIKDCN